MIWTGLTIYLRRHHPSQIHEPRFLAFVFGLCLLILAGAWGLERISAKLGEPYGGIGYLLPVALVGMLVSALIDGRLAAVMVGVCAIPAGIILGDRIDLIVVYFLTGLVSTSRVAGVKKWSDFYKAGAAVSVTAAGVYLGLHLIQRPFHSMAPELDTSLWSGIVCAGLSGMISTAGTLFLLHPLESFLDVTTNLKLLEYSARNEVLRELDHEAPGTYQHSLHVSTLAEAAADAIGGNPLICRVASLYHDIGKLRKPQYFSENQTSANEKRIHSKLSANLSCLLIRNHVKDGLEAAERLRLPKSVTDIIAQHHGTTLISFFYEKALSENPGGKLKESDFRYPGPKPQTVECAIVMLADSIEASSRSLMDTGPGDIQLLVRKVINSKFMDGQFDECDLTLKSLHALSDCFANSLYSLLHRRVSYPRESEENHEAKPLKVRKEVSAEVEVSEVE
jgi:putative nucleotidyltransferase with HDIG domain